MGFGGAMMCFKKKEDIQITKSSLNGSSSIASIDRDGKRSSSEVNSVATSISSADSIRKSHLRSFSQRGNNLRVFSVTELKTATKNFSRSVILGECGFGCVYMGTVKDSNESNARIEIAVKQLGRRGLQGHKEWMTEVNVLGVVEHPNLVKLIGYCAEDDERGTQRLLVYEYMPNRSVDDHLSSRSAKILSWPMRLRIALDAGRGLSYLHEGMDFQIIFRDLKTSNILLDEHWNAKLSDFGLAREGPEEGLTHVSTAIVGTLGYAAPEYMHTGRLTAKSDIWSFGVVLYELITGRRPIDKNRPKSEQNLLDWVKPYISDAKKFRMILDPRLDTRSTLKSAMHLSVVANRCLVRQAKSRPSMSEVLEMLQKIVANTNMEAPQPSLKTPASSPTSKKGRLDLKRRLSEPKKSEGKLSVWRLWTPKLMKTN